MVSRAILSQRSKLFIGDLSSPPDYIQVKDQVSWNGPDGQSSEIDITNLDSVAREKLAGLQDFGQFSIEGNFVPDDPGQLDLLAARANQELRPFIFVLRTGHWFRFNASVLQAASSGGVDAKVDFSVVLSISGAYEGPFASTPEIVAMVAASNA